MNPGNVLKSCRQIGSPMGDNCNTSIHPRWDSYDTYYGTNDFGFNALPAGRRFSTGSLWLGVEGYWWSSTESSTGAWMRSLRNNSKEFTRNSHGKNGAYSVRCVKDN